MLSGALWRRPVTGRPGSVPAFIATTGGHLVELNLMATILEPARHGDALWITHRTPQSETMLAGRRVHYVPYISPRKLADVVLRTPGLLRLLRRENVDVVYSTGASVSLAALPLAPLVSTRPVFIESLARAQGPSLAGRVHGWLPWVRCYTQYPGNVSRSWEHAFNLLDSFSHRPPVPTRPQRVLVTVGTIRPYGFRRLLQRVRQVVPADTDVVWQTGATDVTGLELPGRWVGYMSDDDFAAEVARADVVIAHAGVGTVIRCLENGKVPLLAPRRAAHGEHVDDHQTQITAVAAARGFAVAREADAIRYEDLVTAASLRVGPAEPAGGSTALVSPRTHRPRRRRAGSGTPSGR